MRTPPQKEAREASRHPSMMPSDTQRTNGEQFTAMGHSSAYDSHHQQQRSNSAYPKVAARPIVDSQGNSSSTTQQQPAGQYRSSEMIPSQLATNGALGILADVALAGGGVSTTSRPTRLVQTESGSTGMNGRYIHPPISHTTRLASPPSSEPARYSTPSTTGEYRQHSRSAEITASVPGGNPYPWIASTNPTHLSYNQQPSVIETAASLQSIAMSGPSTSPQSANRVTTSSDSVSPRSSSTMAKKKSSYIISQMEKMDKVKQDSVGRDKDRANYFASYAYDHGQHVVASPSPPPHSSSHHGATEHVEEDAHVNGNEKSPSGKEQESTRDKPGNKYVKMFEEAGQQRYEEAILEILDGMELPR